jgi:hypothetical protein
MRRRREEDEAEEEEEVSQQKRRRISDEAEEEEDDDAPHVDVADAEFARMLDGAVRITGPPLSRQAPPSPLPQRQRLPPLQSLPFDMREGQPYIDLGSRRHRARLRDARTREANDNDADPATADAELTDAQLEEISREYYPAEGGWVRDRQTGELRPGQDETAPYNRLDLELEDFLLRQLQEKPDYIMAQFVSSQLQRPIDWAIDTGDLQQRVRAAARAQSEQKLRDELVKAGLGTVERDLNTARIRLAAIAAEQTYAKRQVSDRAGKWLRESGAELWPRLTGIDTSNGVCAGMMMPYYWRWQYRLWRDDILTIPPATLPQNTPPPAPELMERVRFIVETDAAIFGQPWITSEAYRELTPVLLLVPAMGQASIRWRHTFNVYMLERDVWERPTDAVVPHTIAMNPGTQGTRLQRIASQSQWLSSILFYHADRAFHALPTFDTTKDGVVLPLLAARNATRAATGAGNGLLWPPDTELSFRTGRPSAAVTYPYLSWTTATVGDGDGVAPVSIIEPAIPNLDDLPRVMHVGSLHAFIRPFDPWLGIRTEGNEPFIAGLPERVPGVPAELTDLLHEALPPDVYLGNPALTPTTLVAWRGFYGAAPIAGGAPPSGLTDLRDALMLPERLLSREFRQDRSVNLPPYTTRYPSLACYERVCDILDAMTGPHLRTLMQQFMPTGAEAAMPSRQFGFDVATSAETDLQPEVGQRLGASTIAIQPRLPFFEVGTWRDLFSRMLDPVFITRDGSAASTQRTVQWRADASRTPDAVRDEIDPTSASSRDYLPVNRFDPRAWDPIPASSANDGLALAADSILKNVFMGRVVLPGLVGGLLPRAMRRTLSRPDDPHLFLLHDTSGDDGDGMGISHEFPFPLLTPIEREATQDETTEESRRSAAAQAAEGTVTTTRTQVRTTTPLVDPRANLNGTLYARASEERSVERYLALTKARSTLLADAGEPEMSLQSWLSTPGHTAANTAGLRGLRLDRLRFWQSSFLNPPWTTIALFMDFVRWTWADSAAGGGDGSSGTLFPSYKDQLAEQNKLIRILEERMRRRAALDYRMRTLIDVARDDFLPTSAYMHLPHIAGRLVFSAAYRTLLAEGTPFMFPSSF